MSPVVWSYSNPVSAYSKTASNSLSSVDIMSLANFSGKKHSFTWLIFCCLTDYTDILGASAKG